MARIIAVDGTETTVTPKNGTDFKCEELQAIVGGLFEIVYLPNGDIMACDDEAKLKNKPINVKATQLYANPYDYICGTALV